MQLRAPVVIAILTAVGPRFASSQKGHLEVRAAVPADAPVVAQDLER